MVEICLAIMAAEGRSIKISMSDGLYLVEVFDHTGKLMRTGSSRFVGEAIVDAAAEKRIIFDNDKQPAHKS